MLPQPFQRYMRQPQKEKQLLIPCEHFNYIIKSAQYLSVITVSLIKSFH